MNIEVIKFASLSLTFLSRLVGLVCVRDTTRGNNAGVPNMKTSSILLFAPCKHNRFSYKFALRQKYYILTEIDKSNIKINSL